MDKKGALEVQFHWIFVMIAGAVILVFFLSFIARQRASAESSLIFDIKNELSLLITSAESSTGLVPVEIYDLEVGFNCNEFTIKDQRQALLGKPVFASQKIKGEKLLLWSASWKIPFKVDNFLYITSPKVRYIFIGNDDGVYDILPDSINKEKINVNELNSITDEGDYQIKIIVFPGIQGYSLGVPKWMEKYDVTVIKITPDNSLSGIKTGKVEYYRQSKLAGSSNYFTEQGLLGAIFSDTAEDYNCAMEKAVSEINALAKFYGQRTKLLSGSGIPCANLFYGDADQFLFSSLASLTEDKTQWKTKIEDITNLAGQIENRNNNIQYQSCPVIY